MTKKAKIVIQIPTEAQSRDDNPYIARVPGKNQKT